MIRINNSIFILFIVGFIINSCSKNKDPEDKYSKHEKKFSCYVNGEKWMPYDDLIFNGPGSLIIEFVDTAKYIHISANRRIKDKNLFDGFDLYLKGVTGPGTYSFYVPHDKVLGFYDLEGHYPCTGGYYNQLDKGTFILSYYNKETRNLKGQFSMTLRNPSCGADSLIIISNGNLDTTH